MKNSSLTLAGAVGLLLTALALPTFAADAAKEVTITGNATCAKCALHETKKCETVIQSEKNGKKVTYYLTANDTAKAFHKNVCEEGHKATATGTVEMKDGKEMFTASKIELAK